MSALGEKEIGTLLEWFKNRSDAWQKYVPKRRIAHEENRKWIQPSVIQTVPDAELKTKFLTYFETGGGRQTLIQIPKQRLVSDVRRLRKTILYLLDEAVKIETRVDGVIGKGGEQKIEGFGRAIATSILMDFNQEKYCLWNHKTSMGFTALGWPTYDNVARRGEAYIKVLEALDRLKRANQSLDLTFEDVDCFLHTISAEEEGRAALAAIIAGKSPAGTVSSQDRGLEIRILERILEEFIEANFDKLDFGDGVELYHDEDDVEATGRQFPTDVGRIDLLAVDNKKKEFVVIELKKDRGGDAVVGQILKYMGWVSERLAAPIHYSVRGIVVVGEEDEKLTYALKLIPKVTMMTYRVSFELKSPLKNA